MMNPATYLREAERIERETASRISCERLQRPRLAYSREELASGCVLYLMLLSKTCCVRDLEPWGRDRDVVLHCRNPQNEPK